MISINGVSFRSHEGHQQFLKGVGRLASDINQKPPYLRRMLVNLFLAGLGVRHPRPYVRCTDTKQSFYASTFTLLCVPLQFTDPQDDVPTPPHNRRHTAFTFYTARVCRFGDPVDRIVLLSFSLFAILFIEPRATNRLNVLYS